MVPGSTSRAVGAPGRGGPGSPHAALSLLAAVASAAAAADAAAGAAAAARRAREAEARGAAAHRLVVLSALPHAPPGSLDAQLARVEGCLDRIGRLGRLLSTFGRAHAVSGYALPRLLYHAEHMGLPAAAATVEVEKHVARLVERRLGPSAGPPWPRVFAGVRAELLVGRKEVGGFGVLPVLEHVRARWAVAGARLLAGVAAGRAASLPAVQVALGVMGGCGPRWAHPLALLGGPCRPGAEAQRPAPPPAGGVALPGAVLAPAAAGSSAPPPGDWCWGAPLWANPLAPGLHAWRYHPWYLLRSGPVPDLPTLDCWPRPLQRVGDAVLLHRLVAAIPFGIAHRHRYLALLAEWLPARGVARECAYADRQELLDHLEAVLEALPPGWRAAAQVVDARVAAGSPPPPPGPAAVEPAGPVRAAPPASLWLPGAAEGAGPAFWPDPLARMAAGLASLEGGWVFVGGQPPAPGPWCAAAPLWNNPLAPAPPPAPLGAGLERAFPDLCEAGHSRSGGPPTLATVGDVLSVRGRLLAVAAWPAAAYREEVWEPLLHSHPEFASAGWAFRRLEALLAALPGGWRAAAAAACAAGAMPGVGEVLAAVVPRLAWVHPTGRAVPLARLTVRAATDMQLGALRRARALAHDRFLRLACADPAAGPAPAVASHTELRRVFRRMLRTRWDNRRLEVYWRLALNGLPTAERLHRPLDACAACGALGPGCAHHFWDCPLAVAVRGAVAQALPAGVLVGRAHVWLARVPSMPAVPGLPGMPVAHAGLWAAVCLAALGAMDAARRGAFRARAAAAAGAVLAEGAAPASLAASRAVVHFWDLLQDFASSASPPPPWVAAAASWPGGHPLVREDGGRLVVHRPPASPV